MNGSIEQLIASGTAPEKAERQVLGFSLRDLSRKLAVDWSLGDLLKDTLDGKEDAAGRASNIVLGHTLARTIELHGMQAPETVSVLRRIAAHLETPVERVQSLVSDNLAEALQIARSYGVRRLETVLPPAPEVVAKAAAQAGVLSGSSQVRERVPAERQLKALAALTEAIESGEPVDVLMQRLLAGVHEGIGFDRTYFALLTPDRRSLQAKYVLGQSPEGFAGAKRLLRGSTDFFQSLLDSGRVGRFHPGDKAADAANLGWLSAGDCLCMPVSLNGKPLGVLYADRSRSCLPLDDDSVDAFRLFGAQIPVLLMLARKHT